jgi:hypothetical protein
MYYVNLCLLGTSFVSYTACGHLLFIMSHLEKNKNKTELQEEPETDHHISCKSEYGTFTVTWYHTRYIHIHQKHRGALMFHRQMVHNNARTKFNKCLRWFYTWMHTNSTGPLNSHIHAWCKVNTWIKMGFISVKSNLLRPQTASHARSGLWPLL